MNVVWTLMMAAVSAWAGPAPAGNPQALSPLLDDAHSGQDADNGCIVAGQNLEMEFEILIYGSLLPLLDPSDVYEFNVVQDALVRFTMNPTPFYPGGLPQPLQTLRAPDYDLVLYNSACVPIAANPKDGNAQETIVVPLQPGRYHVQVARAGPVPATSTLPMVQPEGESASTRTMCDPFCELTRYSLVAHNEGP